LELIDARRAGFRETDQAQVDQARTDAVARMNGLGQMLDRWGSNGQAWKEFLLWDRLSAQLASSTGADEDELVALLERLSASHEGLERPEFMQLRGALSRYYHRLRAVGNDSLASEFAERMDQLSELVAALRDRRDGEQLQKISQHLDWLVRHEQVPDVVLAVRDLAPVANVRVTVSQSFVTQATREPVDRVDPLTDVVLGTTVRGTSHLVGSMAAYPIAGSEAALLEARLTGDADTAGRGYNGPVRANVVGKAAVEATGQILFDAEGFEVGPTSAHVSATGRPTQLWTTCHSRLANGLITCVARRRAQKTQQLGDCIASRHAEVRLRRQVGEELQTRVETLQDSYETRFRNPLLRRETFPRIFEAASHHEGAQLEMLLASAWQTGAFQTPPPSQIAAPFHAQIHETAFNNLASSMLAGRTVSEVELRRFAGRLFGEDAEPSQVRSGDELHIVLADERPISCLVDRSAVTIKIRAKRFIRRRTSYPAMNMMVTYNFVQLDGDLAAQRAAEPEIVPRDFELTGPRRLAAREVAARRLIATMLQRELAESYSLGSVKLPEQSPLGDELLITHLRADNGWLELGAQSAE
jgi:hypothetical protein